MKQRIVRLAHISHFCTSIEDVIIKILYDKSVIHINHIIALLTRTTQEISDMFM